MPVQILVATRKYSDYILYPNLTETAAQAAMPTKSYGNFGLGQEVPHSSIRLCIPIRLCMQSGLLPERDFRHIKSDDLNLRPVFHRLEERVKAHVLICMLACYLSWHLR